MPCHRLEDRRAQTGVGRCSRSMTGGDDARADGGARIEPDNRRPDTVLAFIHWHGLVGQTSTTAVAITTQVFLCCWSARISNCPARVSW